MNFVLEAQARQNAGPAMLGELTALVKNLIHNQKGASYFLIGLDE